MMIVCMLFGCTSRTIHMTRQDNEEAAKIYLKLGVAYMQQGRYQRAKQKLLNAIKLTPQNPDVHSALGYYFETVGENDLAESHYLKAMALAHQSGATLNNYGTFLCRQKQYQQAIQHFVEATKRIDYLKVAEAYENAGLCALEIPDIAAAEQYFIKALKHNMNQKSALYFLSQISYDKKAYSMANQYLQRYFEVSQPTQASLELAIDLSRELGDNLAQQYYAEQLESQLQ